MQRFSQVRPIFYSFYCALPTTPSMISKLLIIRLRPVSHCYRSVPRVYCLVSTADTSSCSYDALQLLVTECFNFLLAGSEFGQQGLAHFLRGQGLGLLHLVLRLI